MAHPVFEVRKFKALGRYEIHFGKDSEGFFFYEIEDLESLAQVDVKDSLTEGDTQHDISRRVVKMGFKLNF